MEPSKSIIDLTFLRSFSNGNNYKVNNYIGLYLKTALPLFGELEENLETITNADLYRRVHSLKPQTSYVRIIGLAELLAQIENAIMDNQDKIMIRELMRNAIELNKKGMAALEKYLTT